MLERFRWSKSAEIEALRDLDRRGKLPLPYGDIRPPFSEPLKDDVHGAIIAEFKQASPSSGVINTGWTPEGIAASFARGGATALSVLTEKEYFKGDLDFLFRMSGYGLPLLRKDFLFDPLQVVETASTPASAMLLIVRMFSSVKELAPLMLTAAGFGLECVVEIFNERDLDMARQAGADIIQVNNRDLETLEVDTSLAARLIEHRLPRETWICASGVTSALQVRRMAERGYDALLVGTWLMQHQNPETALRDLLA